LPKNILQNLPSIFGNNHLVGQILEAHPQLSFVQDYRNPVYISRAATLLVMLLCLAVGGHDWFDGG
jgi:hypothetical protein